MDKLGKALGFAVVVLVGAVVVGGLVLAVQAVWAAVLG